MEHVGFDQIRVCVRAPVLVKFVIMEIREL